MSELKQLKIRISETQADEMGNEEVTATIRNDNAKNVNGQPIFDKEFSYQMDGIFLHAPIPKEITGGFKTAKEAENAARAKLKEWRSGNIPPDTKVTRQEYWSMKYYSAPYLKDLSSEELNERHAIVSNNMQMITEKRQLGIISMNEQGDYWAAAYSDVISESGLRGGFQGEWLKGFSIPDYDWVGIDKVSEVFHRLNLEEGNFLVKYGEEKYIKNAFENGEIRIAPASSYKDSS